MIRFRLRIQMHEYELPAGRTVLGRAATCNLTIDDALLSREHAAIRITDGSVVIRDLGSRNGTWVNNEQALDDVELHDGDRIRIGSTELLFSRVVTTRRALTSATAALAECPSCQQAYVAKAPCCPRCGEPGKATSERRTKSHGRRDFWLSLEVELLEKAIDVCRFDEAEESMRRLQSKLDELITARKSFDRVRIERALCAAIRLGRARGQDRTLAWAIDVLRRLELLPTPELFALIASTAPILLESARDSLQALIATSTLRGLTPTDRSCLESLTALFRELVAFGAMRSHDTAPRSTTRAQSPVGGFSPETDREAGAAAR